MKVFTMHSAELRNIPFLKNASQDFITSLESTAQISEHTKGKILFIHEEQANRFYYIKSGWVKLFRETLDGAQSVVDVLPAGEIFGENAIFENDTYTYSAEIVEKSEIISLPLEPLKAELESNNTLTLDMLKAMARKRRQQERELEHISIQNASQRIGCFLLRLTNIKDTGPTSIHLPYDKTLVAARLGMQPETFSRALAKLREKTGIRVKGSTIELDTIKQLSNYSCSACTSEFPCKDLKASA